MAAITLSRGSSWLAPALAAAVLAALALMGARIGLNVSLVEPLILQTSGAEAESHFAVWKAVNDRPVFADPRKMPFALSNYNWFFYESFGRVTAAAQRLLDLEDAWIPTIGRLFDLAGALAGVIVTWFAFGPFCRREEREAQVLRAGLSALAFLGPLVGFWALTVRPDVWSSVFEVAAIGTFAAWWLRAPWRSVLAALVLAWIAWSFKQVALFAPMGIGLFLLLRLRILHLLVFSCGFLGLAAATYALLDETSWKVLVELRDSIGFSTDPGVKNLANFAVKTLPATLPALAALWLVLRNRETRRAAAEDDPTVLAVPGAVAAVAVAALAAGKVGGAENYYFTPHIMVGMAAFALISISQRSPRPSPLPWTMAAIGSLATVAAVAVVLSGLHGRVSLRGQHETLSTLKACMVDLPQPLFVANPHLSLPWNNPSAPHFVLSWRYERERRFGVAFEHDGIGGLIEAGHFASLLLPGPAERFDNGSLDLYEFRPPVCADWAVYVRKGGSRTDS